MALNVNSGNLAFEDARARVNIAKQNADLLKGHKPWLNSLSPANISTRLVERRTQAALFLKVINDVAGIMNTEVQEASKKGRYPFELSGYEISEDSARTVEEAANRLETLANNPKGSIQQGLISEQINAFNPNNIPTAQTQTNTDLDSYAGKISDAIATGEKYQPKQSQALTLDNLKLPTSPAEWGKMFRPDISEGKVRTNVWLQGQGIMVARDTTSAMDIPNLVDVPGKGAMLTGITNYWLDNEFKTIAQKLGMSDHRIPGTENTDPNVMVVSKVKPLPVEVVLRRHITGSAFKAYKEEGLRDFGSHKLPEGIQKNDRLDSIVVDPTIKGRDQDIRISDGVAANLVGYSDWQKVKEAATELFKAAEQKANEKGLMLVDTKFEFGKTADGKIVLIDEVLTPDSSRYWSIDDYKEAIAQNREPKDYSKEPLRDWVKSRDRELGSTAVAQLKKDKAAYKAALGEVPQEVVTTLAQRYAAIYNALTGKEFNVDLQGHADVNARILANLKQAKLLKS